MNTIELPRCPQCGLPVPADAPGGLCPRCVLGGVASAAGQDTSHSHAPADPPPSIEAVRAAFPQLDVLECIGQGGMGVVYRARQPRLNRVVALKLLSERLSLDPAFAGRFEREGQALARLNHPNIVAVYDFGQAGGFFYLIMEYVDGVNLRQAMGTGRFTPAEALALVPQICAALQFAHDAGILHRDIKPENILLDSKGRVKLADFGIAKLMGDKPGPGTLTASGVTLGTPSYMAPEQIERPAEVDHRADIYSLGVVFYELLTGELPLGRFQPPSAKAHLDARIDEIVLRALAKERELRQQSAAEVRTQVEGLPASGEAGAVAPKASAPAVPSRGVWKPLLTAAVVILVLVALGLPAIVIRGYLRAQNARQAAVDAAQQLAPMEIEFPASTQPGGPPVEIVVNAWQGRVPRALSGNSLILSNSAGAAKVRIDWNLRRAPEAGTYDCWAVDHASGRVLTQTNRLFLGEDPVIGPPELVRVKPGALHSGPVRWWAYLAHNDPRTASAFPRLTTPDGPGHENGISIDVGLAPVPKTAAGMTITPAAHPDAEGRFGTRSAEWRVQARWFSGLRATFLVTSNGVPVPSGIGGANIGGPAEGTRGYVMGVRIPSAGVSQPGSIAWEVWFDPDEPRPSGPNRMPFKSTAPVGWMAVGGTETIDLDRDVRHRFPILVGVQEPVRPNDPPVFWQVDCQLELDSGILPVEVVGGPSKAGEIEVKLESAQVESGDAGRILALEFDVLRLVNGCRLALELSGKTHPARLVEQGRSARVRLEWPLPPGLGSHETWLLTRMVRQSVGRDPVAFVAGERRVIFDWRMTDPETGGVIELVAAISASAAAAPGQ